ncbi:MAG: molybdenum cofactor guanylyltransferase [Clostridiales Family XIII bacterium]|jgi:molybdopterin-guanine dinucleotide biosynthesis protein A|nr:molybdenum cofactor guanylyltransferase [Clostridiales Family XIII bacterium]
MTVNGANRISDVKAVVLSGGKSRRMGSDKLLLPRGGKTFLEYAVQTFSRRFEHVAISVSDINRYADRDIDAERIADIYRGRGPLGGLHAALRSIARDSGMRGVFLIAADLPFAGIDAASVIIDQGRDCGVCVPVDEHGRYEPLFAYYAKTVLPNVEETLNAGVNKVVAFYPNVTVQTLPASALGTRDPHRLFFNINYPEDYDRFKSML